MPLLRATVRHADPYLERITRQTTVTINPRVVTDQLSWTVTCQLLVASFDLTRIVTALVSAGARQFLTDFTKGGGSQFALTRFFNVFLPNIFRL